VRVVNRLGGFGMSFLGLRLARDLGMPLADIGLVLAVFGLCTVPSRVLGGVLTTRRGCRPTIVLGLLSCAVAQLAIAIGPSAPTVVAGVLALGLAYEIIEPATQALIVESIPRAKQASTFALLWSTLAVAGVMSGMLAALLTGWGVSALFVADAMSSLIAAGAAARLLPAATSTIVSPSWRAALTPGLIAWTGVGTVYAVLVMVVVFMLPLTVQVAGWDPTVTAWLLAVGAAAATAAQRIVARCEGRLGPTTLLVIGHVTLAAGLALWTTGRFGCFLAGAVLEGASGALCLGTYPAVAGRMAQPGQAAAVMTVFGLSWGVATVVSPLVGTALLARGSTALWSVCCAVSLALAALHAAPGRGGSRPRGGGRGGARTGRGGGVPGHDGPMAERVRLESGAGNQILLAAASVADPRWRLVFTGSGAGRPLATTLRAQHRHTGGRPRALRLGAPARPGDQSPSGARPGRAAR
jgi:MFS family permease